MTEMYVIANGFNPLMILGVFTILFIFNLI